MNVAFSYTSREEMTQAIRKTATAVSRGILEPSDISEELLERCLYTAHSPSVDLLIRDAIQCCREIHFSEMRFHNRAI